MIDFLAFDDACGAIRGRIDLIGNRMADLLALGTAIAVHDVELHDLGTRATRLVDASMIEPARLAIVVATGPRGARTRRIETRTRPVSITIGRYLAHGLIHAAVPPDPMVGAFDRVWIPLTEAVLEYQGDGRLRRERFDALLVNRAAAQALTALDAALYEVHWLAGREPEPLFRESAGS
jgi:hypothetical protein